MKERGVQQTYFGGFFHSKLDPAVLSTFGNVRTAIENHLEPHSVVLFVLV